MGLFNFIKKLFSKKEIKYENLSVFDKKPVSNRPPFNGYCNFCNKKIGGLDVYFCKYCNKYHCGEHRLPEEHNCANPSKPKSFTSSSISYSRNN